MTDAELAVRTPPRNLRVKVISPMGFHFLLDAVKKLKRAHVPGKGVVEERQEPDLKARRVGPKDEVFARAAERNIGTAVFEIDKAARANGVEQQMHFVPVCDPYPRLGVTSGWREDSLGYQIAEKRIVARHTPR